MNRDTEQLLRYLDGELSPAETQRFRVRLAHSPALRAELGEMRRVGDLVRVWARGVEPRAAGLLEPTLARVHTAERRRSRASSVGAALAALALLLPWSAVRELPGALGAPSAPPVAGAAIERLDAADRPAQVFVLGSAATPVVWLADDDVADDAGPEQGPG